MRIGLVIDHLQPQRSGAAQWTVQFAEQLLGRGHEVHIVAEDFAPDTLRLPFIPHQLPHCRSRLEIGEAAEKKLKTLGLDVIHENGLGWYCDLFESHDGSRFAQWEQKLRVLPAWARPWKRRLTRVLPRYREFRRLIARQFADRDRLILALSQMVADDYVRYHGVRPEQLRLIHNGVDTERFSPDHREAHRARVRESLGVSDDTLVLLFVGHDFVRKGLATAIRATGRLVAAGHPVKLIVLGRNRPTRYAWLARRSGAAEAVAFLGAVNDPVPYYAAADAYVLPTFFDPCSLAVLEAAASGLPSITTRFNGAGELLTDDIDGYILSDPADDEELGLRCEQLLDAQKRRQMGEAARQLALRNTLRRNCDRILAVYNELAPARRRSA